MKKLILNIIVLLLTSSLFSIEITSSDSTDYNHPGEYAVDGDLSRSWQLSSNENYGWLSLKLDETEDIKALKIDGDFTNVSELYISYVDDNGILQDFFTGFNIKPDYRGLIDLSSDNVMTDNIYIRLYDKSDLRSSISNIEIISEKIEGQIVKKKADVLLTGSNSSVYSPEYNLIDGKTGTYWKAENNLNWGKVQWAVKEFLDKRFKYKKKNIRANKSYVDLKPEGKISKISFYSLDEGKGTYTVNAYDDAGNRTNLANGENLVEGWIAFDVEEKNYSKVTLQIDSFDQNDFPRIGEIDFFGKRETEKDEVNYLTPYYYPSFPSIENNNYFEWKRGDKFPVIEVIQPISNTNEILLNGYEIVPNNIKTFETHKVISYILKENELLDGYNFIDKNQLLGVRIIQETDLGYFVDSNNTLTDGVLFNDVYLEGENVINLGSNVQLSQIEVYSTDSGYPRVFALVNNIWEEIYNITETEGKLVYRIEKISSSIMLDYIGNVGEVRVWGSFEDINTPEVDIFYPFHNIDLESHKPGYSVFVVEVNDFDADVTIGGIKAQNYGNIYWIEMKQLKLPKFGIETIEVVAESRLGITSSKSIDLIIHHNGYKDSILGDEIIFTSSDTVLIEGNSNQWRSKLLIDDTEYSINGHNFGHYISIDPGFNRIKVEFIDKKGNVVKTFYKYVFRETSNLVLKLLNNNGDIVTTKDNIKISGFVKGFGDLKVTVNGTEANVDGFSFVSEDISLFEGNNLITIEAGDELGNTSKETFKVIKDTVAPSLSNIKPLFDEIISTANVVFEGDVTRDLGVKVFVNGYIATLEDGIKFSKELAFPDGIISVEIYAVDKAVNKSQVFKTQIITDTTPPEDFVTYAEPSTWSTNTTPVITFNTTDITTSVSYYEVRIDNGEWNKIESPYTLPELEDGIHNVEVRATDDAGHSTSSFVDVYVDTVAPEEFIVTSDPDTWANNNTPTITFNTTDTTSGVHKYEVSIDGGDWVEITSPYTIPEQEDGEHNIKVRATDKAGIYTDSEVTVYVDTVAPEEFTVTADPESWSANITPEITFITTDATSGVAKYEVSIDDGDWVEITSPYTIPEQEDGEHNIIVRATDKAGLYTDSEVTVYVDTVAPTDFTVVAAPNTWADNNIPEIIFNTTDATSGVDKYEVSIDGGDWVEITSPYTIPEQEDGEHNIKVRATDKAGIYTDSEVTVYVDTVAPEEFTVTADPESWSANITPEITFNSTDATSGVHKYEVSIDDGDWVEITSPYTIPEQEDGEHNVVVRATDKAGLYTDSEVTVYVDTVAPNDFVIFQDPDGWTNNTTPTITFYTTDVTSDIDYYEYKIKEDGEWNVITSPYTLPSLGEGDYEYELFVRATDLAGNATTESKIVQIDTVPPESIEIFRSIPKKNSIELEWTPSVSKDVLEYRIVRTPNWEDGDFVLDDKISSYSDDRIIPSLCYEYKIITVDRAYNNSNEVNSGKVIVGLEVDNYNDEEGNVVEYENLSLVIPDNSLSDDVLEIHITEVESDDLKRIANNIFVGPIYSTSVVKKVGDKRISQDHVAFEKDYLAALTYNEEDIPEGFVEQNLGVYYFDTMWGKWFKVEDSAVDKENNKIYFTTNHFTDFSVQPTITPTISPQDYKAMGISPYSEGHSDVYIDPQSGSVSMSIEELSLPGRGNFDFKLRRTYSSVRARKDSFNMSLAKSIGYKLNQEVEIDIKDKLKDWGIHKGKKLTATMKANLIKTYENNTDYIYSMGAGWKFDLPGINSTDHYINITIPGGGIYPLNQMSLIKNSKNENNKIRELVFENHVSSDFTVIIRQVKAKSSAIKSKLLDSGEQITGSVAAELYDGDIEYWSMYEAELILKDGSKYIFDNLGRVWKHIDALGVNEISFKYNKDRLKEIKDSLDRVIEFEYVETNFIPLINKITTTDFNGNRKIIEYTIDNRNFLGLLKKYKDSEGREWLYNYRGLSLSGNNSDCINVKTDDLINNFLNPGGVNSIAKEVSGVDEIELSESYQAQWVDALDSVTGPGIGEVKINYIAESMIYSSTEISDDFNGLYDVEGYFSYGMLENLLVKDSTLKNGSLSETTTYNYEYEYIGEKQFINKKTEKINSNKKTIYHYMNIPVLRKQYISTSDDAIEEDTVMKHIYIPKCNNIKVQTVNGKTLRSSYTSYYSDTLHLESQMIEYNLEQFKSSSYNYDNWGNIVYKLDVNKVGDRGTKLETWLDYIDTENLFKSDLIDYTQYDDVELNNKYIKSLVKSSLVKNYTIDNDYIVKKDIYEYYENGKVKSSILDSTLKDYETKYEYDQYGNIDKVTSPEGNIIEYDWSYSIPFDILTTTVKNVENIDENGNLFRHDISEKAAYERASGLKAWEKNGEGYYTLYKYDSLGRIEYTKKPVNKLTTDPDRILTSGEDLYQNVLYIDDYNITIVTDAENNDTKYKYDSKGNLIKITKWVDITIENPKGREIVTDLKYDVWGNITEVKDPNKVITKYGYDLFNNNTSISHKTTNFGNGLIAKSEILIDHKYLENTIYKTDEVGNEFYEIVDMDNRVIESGLFKNNTKTPLLRRFYDGVGNVIKEIDGEGNSTRNIYDDRFLLSRSIMPKEVFFNPVTKEFKEYTPYIDYGYNDDFHKNSETRNNFDNKKNQNFKVNSIGLVYQTEIPYTNYDGSKDTIITKTGYNNNGKEKYLFDGKNNKTSYEFNHLGFKSSETIINNKTEFQYDKLGNITKLIDPREEKYDGYDTTYTIDYHYDELYRIVGADLPRAYGNDKRGHISFTYDDVGNVKTKKNVNNVVINYEYNKRNMLLKEYKTTPSNNKQMYSIEYGYNKKGLETYRFDGNSKIISTYTALDDIEDVTINNITTTTKYDLNRNKILFIDGKKNETITEYDSYNRVKTITDAKGNITKYAYDLSGNITYFKDGNNNITTYIFDELNRSITEKKPNKFYEKIRYDKNNNIIKKIDFNGSVFSYNYKDLNLIETQISDKKNVLKHKINYKNDEVSNLKEVIVTNFKKDNIIEIVKTEYNKVNGKYISDPFGRVHKLTTTILNDNKFKTSSVEFSYDIYGNEKSIKYPNGEVVTKYYDEYGFLDSLSDYIMGSLSYKNNGLLASYTLSNGVTYDVNYNKANQINDFKYYTPNTSFENYRFVFDGAGNIDKKNVNGNINSYIYDEINQLTDTDSFGNFEINPSQLDNSLEIGTVNEDYNGTKSLDLGVNETILTLDADSMSIGFDLGYKASLNRLILTPTIMSTRLKKDKLVLYYSDNNINWFSIPRDEWSFELFSDYAEISLLYPQKARYVKLHCIYDERTRLDEPDKQLSEIYNSKETLLTAYFTVERMQEHFKYDSAGNRISSDVNYDGITQRFSNVYKYYKNTNLLKDDGDFGYKWDNNGNLVSKSNKYIVNGDEVIFVENKGILTTYTYDLSNRLIEVKITNYEKGSEDIVKYSYDYRGYRIKREENNNVTYYSFDLEGDLLSKENKSKNENLIYLFGKIIAKNNDERTLFYNTDHLGSVISITDDSGDLLWSNNYSSFGNSLQESGIIEENGLYSGKEIDPTTGIYYFNARWYDSNLGRFITEDPIKDGNNWYIYCKNNPLKYIDPTGLDAALTMSYANDLYNYSATMWASDPTGPNFPDAEIVGTIAWIGAGVVTGVGLLQYAIERISYANSEELISEAITTDISSVKEWEEENSKDFVYHASNADWFGDLLAEKGTSEIRIEMPEGDKNRFGYAFYVAEEPETAFIESKGNPFMLKFSIEKDRILDLTNPEIAEEYGYTTGLSRKDAKDLILPQIDPFIAAIRFPSEQNPGGTNYAVKDPTILTYEGVWEGEIR